ncbi:MAG: SMC-Scp complex subunit ScpB [Candidatus Ornithomonoglobus sp.]
MDNIKYAIEGILFAAGEPVKAAKLAVVMDKQVQEIEDAVTELKAEYDRDHRGFNIIEISDGYQICSRPEYYTYIREILGEQRNQPLSNAAMEALAIIAYKQPVTRGMVEKIRGVNSDGCVNRLYERGLIEECGRLDAPGRPILYKTTDTFLRCFGLRTPRDLPPINFKNIMPELAQTGEQLSITEDDENGGMPQPQQQADEQTVQEPQQEQ